MTRTMKRLTGGFARLGLLTLVLVGVGFGVLSVRNRGASAGQPGLPTAIVHRANLVSTVRAPGEVDSSEKTLIECELEAVTYRNAGVNLSVNGSSTIIELLDQGTMVEKGDVICRLDASEYEELVRQEQIEVQEDRALYEAAKLDLESQEIQLREYRDGQLEQLKQQYQGQIALAQADMERQKDRLAWSERMVEIGYMPLTRLRGEQQLMQQTEITLSRTKLAYDNLLKYTAPKMILTLQGRIDTYRSIVTYRETRLRREEEQLAYYRDQVEKCTIRAPHDGFLIYANEDDDETRVELGATVRANQDLFFLPDLDQMEVKATIHETAVVRLAKGMPAQVRIESLPDVLLEGELVQIAPLPMSKRSWRQADDVKNYEAIVQLHVIPEGLLPGMTAQVDIQTSHRPDALVIPPEALAIENGQDVCYVAVGDLIERRAVEIGELSATMIEILDGLDEGERVVTLPDQVDHARLAKTQRSAPRLQPDIEITTPPDGDHPVDTPLSNVAQERSAEIVATTTPQPTL